MPKKKATRAAPKKKSAAREAILEPLERATAAQKKEWERAEKTIVHLRSGGTELYDELWETVQEVLEDRLYLGGGMKTEKEFIEKMLPGEDKRSVARNTLVAVAFTPKDEAEKGITFLEEVALYAKELSGSDAMPRAIDLDRLRIPVKRSDGDIVRKPARNAYAKRSSPRATRSGRMRGARCARPRPRSRGRSASERASRA